MPEENANVGDESGLGEKLASLTATMESTKSALEALKTENEGLKQRNEELDQIFLDMTNEREKAKEAITEVADDDKDLEGLDPAVKEYHKKVMAKTIARFEKTIKTAQDEIGRGFAALNQRILVQGAINVAEKAHPDFEEHRGEMVKISRAHPTYDVETCYKMAKMDKAERDEAIKAKDLALKETQKKAQSERISASASGLGAKPLGKDEAAQVAFDEVFPDGIVPEK